MMNAYAGNRHTITAVCMCSKCIQRCIECIWSIDESYIAFCFAETKSPHTRAISDLIWDLEKRSLNKEQNLSWQYVNVLDGSIYSIVAID